METGARPDNVLLLARARSASRVSWLASCAILALVVYAPALAQRNTLYDGADGVTCEYFNRGAGIRWNHKAGDWIDSVGRLQGDRPFGEALLRQKDPVGVIEINATNLVAALYAGSFPNEGFVLISAPGGPAGVVELHSRESADVELRPALKLLFSNGVAHTLSPSADAPLDCSTYQGLGQRPTMKAGGGHQYHVTLQFNLPAAPNGAKLVKALLSLHRISRQYGDAALALYRLAVPSSQSMSQRERGLATRYRNDHGIGADRDVVFSADFDAPNWRQTWSYISQSSIAESVMQDRTLHFEPLTGRALKVTVPKGGLLGLNMGFNFKEKTGEEPEEIYFRYYLRLANNWRPTIEGGKLPGVSGTYDKAGSGGVRADPQVGWSMRGLFGRASDPNNPMHHYTNIGTYAYHADQPGSYGDGWWWDPGGAGALENNRWYSIEQYFRVNTPGKRDGELRAWIDGVLVFHRTDVRVRDTPNIRIQRIWMNVYHGGVKPSDKDQSLYIDNVVVARRYIGPLEPK